MTTNISTPIKPTWCPECYNFQILAGVKKVLEEKIKSEKHRQNAKKSKISGTAKSKTAPSRRSRGKDFAGYAIVTGIGCHAKIFDYINLNGINTLHGRVLPMCLGIKIGNPNLNVIGFSGDGDAYAEGMEHLIHAARYNSDFKYFVHNNQVFALTVGQPTPTTEIGFKGKTIPQGVKIQPLNPIKLMLASGASFVARVFADAKQVEWVFKKALKHRGFAFIEILQPCLIFHPSTDYKNKIYSLEKAGHDKSNFEQAWKKAQEFDYNAVKKIPVGIFYQEKREVFEDNFEQLKNLKKKGIGWKDVGR